MRQSWSKLLVVVSVSALGACDDLKIKTCADHGGVINDSGSCECPEGTVASMGPTPCVPLEAAEAGAQAVPLNDAGSSGVWSPSGNSGYDAAQDELDAAHKADAALEEAGQGVGEQLADASPRDDSAAVVDAAADVTADAGAPPPACVPVAEVCDGKDSDCDGVVDNGLKNACGAPCGQAVPPEDCGTSKDDNCDGKVNEGCSAPPPSCTPTPEVCDGKDSDCDGVVDNGVLNACGACGAVPVEACNGMDDNCNGQVDEGVKNACGACGAVPAEVCDSKDNDCNGQVDEGVKNACGACGAVPAEVCDGKDNDCDGTVDNGLGTAWYPDCDGDGAAVPTGAVTACAQPLATASCKAYVSALPIGPVKTVGSTIDCNDLAAAYHPGAQFGLAGDGDGDLNCDGRVEPNTVFVTSASGQTRTEFPICSVPEWRPRDMAAPCNCYRPGWTMPDFGGFVPGSARILNSKGQETSSGLINLSTSSSDPSVGLVFPTKLECTRLPNEVTGLGFFFRPDFASGACSTTDTETYAVRQLCR
jgi:hypothetical protein